jgi:MinD superfamily P-loop ATPase
VKELVVLSGKGGTGKTSLVGSFAVLASNKVLADCDVDAANLHLILNPSNRQSHQFWSGQVARIDENICTQCGLCQQQCRFQAIAGYKIDRFSCEGCGLCYHICPERAVTMEDNMAGYWYISDTKYGSLVHAKLGAAQENSGKLVATVRKQARLLAKQAERALIISDGPPGIGCPAISSLSGADLALLVTEPSLSGIHDLERIIGLCRHFRVLPIVCINKYDINEGNTVEIERYCREQGIEVAGKLPFNNLVTEAIIKGLPVMEYSRNGFSNNIIRLWERVSALINKH